MSISKADARKELRARRKAMTEQERLEKSQSIGEKVRAEIDWSQVLTAHVFEPISSLAEVDVTDVISDIKAQYPRIHFYTSRQYDGEWTVHSIAADAPVPTASFDVVLVPMLGYDNSLHRIGYGGGYYDRLLAGQPLAQKIGLCFTNGYFKDLPVEPHDVPLDRILTEDGALDN